MFLHELPDAQDLFLAISDEMSISPSIIEKDYWVMHALWGLQQKHNFELKGGTSLSKGFSLINRFSEDIDVQVYPNPELNLKTGRNHDKKNHIIARSNFFDDISNNLSIPGLSFTRDYEFDDGKMRSAGIRGLYHSYYESLPALKEGILFEIGFDKTTPFEEKNISSWAYDKVIELDINVFDNRALKVKCYRPEYTFVEKLQTISTKYRRNKTEKISSPVNFIRHYYDVYMLLQDKRILDFIKTETYKAYKHEKFGQNDELDLTKNPAFLLSEQGEMDTFSKFYDQKSEIYFNKPPKFSDILSLIKQLNAQL
ncbi:nucleotidyl transferase AbiEii/AbiGii toxin family protein [Thiotrichales bacterium 19S3-7]|nr:nucleotidyl transferase AbiEii/AbiGii toxin family protein [Thiotrichales bacterium 19S3-7]MCF6800790.1 nucleotidyl transferase AbiEii/AbiGii toxin family protein [Thiotrichales bacterium 19S3-11]